MRRVASCLGAVEDRLEALLGVLEAGPYALQIEDTEPTEFIGQDRGLGADHPIHGRGEQGQLEAVGTEGPGDVNVVRVPRAARRDDRDVVESVGAPPLLASTDIDLQLDPPGWR